MSKKLGFLAVAITACMIGVYPIIYLMMDEPFGLLLTKDASLLQNSLWQLAFNTHISLGGIALLVGWTQFVRRFRQSQRRLHQNIGKLYLLAVLISSSTGIVLGFSATGGLVAALGFISLGIVWLAISVLGYRFIRQGQVEQHRMMMTYSYAACFAAVTLRVWLPLFDLFMDDFVSAYRIIAWLCWVPNLALAYVINLRAQKSTAPASHQAMS